MHRTSHARLGSTLTIVLVLTVPHVRHAAGATLFEENFDTSPCGRWAIYYDDCGSDAGCTVYHYTALQDACGSTWGYAYRQYLGNRCMVNTSFTTAGYTNLVLHFWYRNDSGASISVAVRKDGVWTAELTEVGAASSWTLCELSLSGVVTGLRFKFKGGDGQTRRLDCVSVTGEVACTPAVEITQHPSDLALCGGGVAVFLVTASGSNLTYRWQKDGVNLTDGGRVSGSASDVLQITEAEETDSGSYRCVVTGDCGTVISNSAMLTVSDAPTITQGPLSQTECIGDTAVLSITAFGAGSVSYQWQKNEEPLSNGGTISGATSPTLQIADVGVDDEGSYRCVVTDACGTTISSEASLAVTDECLSVSESGHFVTYRGTPLLLAGDSGTQCATQNININHRAWIDDCHARGIRAIHVWSFLAPRQKQDGSVIEARWGYVYPGVTPWPRRTSGAQANDQLYRWNLQAYDDGADGDLTHYWPRMRDMCAYAKSKDMLVGYTAFTGWIKGNSNAWEYHPFNVANGGHLTTNLPDGVTIATPGTEVWQQTWSDTWSNAKKTQWVWERLAIKAIGDLGSYGNVFFVFFDEHSYDEGNMGDHFRDFFRSRGQMWMDWAPRRSSVDMVMSSTFGGDDKNADAVAGFTASPTRPYVFLEGEPYLGDGVRTAIWTFNIGGGSYFFHGDAGQETVQTGIMGYDPYVPGGDVGMIRRDWLGHASRFFNEHTIDLDALRPNNGLVGSGAYCLANPGYEYVVYSKIGASTTFSVDLSAAAGKMLDCRFYNPSNGAFQPTFQRVGGGTQSFTKPNSDDWVLHVYLPAVTLSLTETNASWGQVDVQPATIVPGALTFWSGSTVTLTAAPVEGKSLRHWEIFDPNFRDDANRATIDANASTSFVMTTDTHVNAVWKCGGGAGALLPVILCVPGLWVARKRHA